MKKAKVFFDGSFAGILSQDQKTYSFEYDEDYIGPSISRTLPRENQKFEFDQFPAFFDGLLPEGINLESFLKKAKLDRRDYFNQLLTVGHDLVGAVTVEAIRE